MELSTVKRMALDWMGHESACRGTASGLWLLRTQAELGNVVQDLHMLFPRHWEYQKQANRCVTPSGAVLRLAVLRPRGDLDRFAGLNVSRLYLHSYVSQEEEWELSAMILRSARGADLKVVRE